MNETRGLWRGKRDNKWIVGRLAGYDGGVQKSACIRLYTNSYGYMDCYVNPSTLGECTGLRDKNGKLIFEGDIVTGYFNHEKIIGYIIYGSDATFFIHRNGLYGIGLNNATDWLSVIGNIHDNVELLSVHGECGESNAQ